MRAQGKKYNPAWSVRGRGDILIEPQSMNIFIKGKTDTIFLS